MGVPPCQEVAQGFDLPIYGTAFILFITIHISHFGLLLQHEKDYSTHHHVSWHPVGPKVVVMISSMERLQVMSLVYQFHSLMMAVI